MTAPDRRAAESLLALVGGTPLVRLARTAPAAEVHAKLEYLNPGGSVKDRAALAMVLDAEESGALRPGGTIVEGTSGNTGLGLAQVAAARGYSSLFVLPDKTAVEKLDALRAYGAEIVLTPSALPREHPDHVIAYATRLAKETDGGWLADQYGNPANPDVHRRTTGPEILGGDRRARHPSRRDDRDRRDDHRDRASTCTRCPTGGCRSSAPTP